MAVRRHPSTEGRLASCAQRMLDPVGPIAGAPRAVAAAYRRYARKPKVCLRWANWQYNAAGMPLSSVQKGAIGQFAFLATALATGAGAVEAYQAAADNEGRDAEIRRHLNSAPAIGIQVKVVFSTTTEGGADRYLSLRFSLPEERIQNDPRLWYFLAFYDIDELRLHDPSFLIPADKFHTMARRGHSGGEVVFAIVANLSPDSHDHWTPFRVAPSHLGRRLLEIIDDKSLTLGGEAPQLPPDSIWFTRSAQAT